jgi:signal transduction histidine kinase
MTGGDLSGRVSVDDGPAELRRLANAFNQMATAVGQAARRQADFVANASHQIRNPLTALTLRLEALTDLVDASARYEVDEACREIDRLRAVVDDLLELAASRYVMADHATAIDLSELVADRVRAWQPLAVTSRVEVIGRPSPAWADTDRSLVGSTIDAVLDNAIRYCPPGSRVEVRSGSGGGRAWIEIADDGPGLAPEEFSNIGNRFWRGDHGQNVPGSGLGLAVARELLEVVGGALAFEPARPHGLRVILAVPAPSRW